MLETKETLDTKLEKFNKKINDAPANLKQPQSQKFKIATMQNQISILEGAKTE